MLCLQCAGSGCQGFIYSFKTLLYFLQFAELIGLSNITSPAVSKIGGDISNLTTIDRFPGVFREFFGRVFHVWDHRSQI